MLGRFYEGQECSAARALEEIGERWSILILRDAVFRGFTRFSDFQRALGIAPNILAKRLESFVANGIMEQTPSRGDQFEYRLTKKGQDLKPIIMAMSAWGAKWVRPGRMVYGHRGCSQHGEVELSMRCSACGVPVADSDIEVRARARS
jgi:DNA-binding HxlR family transcriptional regulator